MARYIQDPKTGKLVHASEYRREVPDAPYIQADIESFKSPIDGSIISSRAHLRAHNTRHGVTDSRDYSPEYYERAAKERKATLDGTSPKERQGRIETMKAAWDSIMH